MKLNFILLGIFFIFFISACTSTGKYNGFAQCLTEKEIVMYGTEWCSHCKAQKAMFGKSFEFVNYVDCDKDRSECLINGVRGYPTWKIDGELYPGEQKLEKLASLSGCELKEDEVQA